MSQSIPVPKCDSSFLESLAMCEVANRAMTESMRLGLFDWLEADARSAREVAEHFGFQENTTEALLDLLAAHGLLVKDERGWRNADMASEFLRHDSPFFMGKSIELNLRFLRFVTRDFEALLRGESNVRKQTDDLWGVTDSMDGTEQFARVGPLRDVVEFIADLPGFDDMRLMCDLGGNHGAFSMALLDRQPLLRAELADLEEVAAAANERIAERGYAERMSAFACDLRATPLPVGKYDLLLASHVLYAFMDKLEGFLSALHTALKPGGWFVAHHMDPDSQESQLVLRGREFVTRMVGYPTHLISRERLTDALRLAGFSQVRMAPSGRPASSLILAARKV